jgi:hypothetical protein
LQKAQKRPMWMQKGSVSEISLDQCERETENAKNRLKLNSGITKQLLCAKGKADTCQGL